MQYKPRSNWGVNSKKRQTGKCYANPAQQIGNVTSCSTHKFIHKLNVHKYFNLDEPKYKICCFSCTVKKEILFLYLSHSEPLWIRWRKIRKSAKYFRFSSRNSLQLVQILFSIIVKDLYSNCTRLVISILEFFRYSPLFPNFRDHSYTHRNYFFTSSINYGSLWKKINLGGNLKNYSSQILTFV